MWCKSTIRPGIHNCLGKYFRNGWRLGGTDLSGLCLASNHLGQLACRCSQSMATGCWGPKRAAFCMATGCWGPKRAAFCMATGCRGQKRAAFCMATGCRGPKRVAFFMATGCWGPKRAAFYTATGCAVQNGPPFSPFRPARSKTRPVFYRSGLRGENGAPFFTVLGCAVKTAGCFLQFLGARRKRRPVFHGSWVRGENGEGASRRRKVYPAVRSHVTTRGRASNIRGAALGESWKTMREPLRA